MRSSPVQPLLASFTVIHARLLTGFEEVFHYPTFTSASSHPAADAQTAQADLPDLASIDRAIGVVDDIVKLLAEIRPYMCQTRNRTRFRGTIFGGLPLELMQHVIHFAIESPRDTSTIIKLSHVSQGLRSAITKMPELFVQANYQLWPASAIDEWCSRANSRPLVIAFKADIDSDEANAISKVKATHVEGSQLIYLKFGPKRARHATDGDAGVNSWFARPLPLLRTLCYSDTRRGSISLSFFDLFPSNFPSLQSLYLPETSHLVVGGPFARLQNLGILVCNTQSLQRFVQMIVNLQSLTHLTLYGHPAEATELHDYTPNPIQTMSSLLSLQMARYWGNDAENIDVILDSFTAPNLQILELIDCGSRIITRLAAREVLDTSFLCLYSTS
ncbi:hypothetical protein DL93DRAFT_2161100 [Clavulina sp. PMI_390]|nr:hypothetical protein DL93DRAFT_2161100 [Clavulina sp. PMI_390]